ncbi:MAG TPA: hypothetical protein VGB24_00720 [Longimicrobium sp.]|jgi:hypothetical protein|uniref:hypothetical protein n=1 Tax=Longimicrobium sp. TaxID=2029185 RepID=UPI002ED8BB5A
MTLRRSFSTIAITLMLTAAGCAADPGVGPTLSGDENPLAVTFVAQVNQTTSMEALYHGVVSRDANGCLRAEGSSRTVIWPEGWKLEARGESLFVKDATGSEVGRIGGQFRLGGGEIPSVEFASLSASDAQLLQTRCPGSYWLAGSRADR